VDQKLVSSGPGVDLTIVKVVEVLVETLEASQNSGTRMLNIAEAGLDLLGKTVPELLGTVPVAEVRGVVAECITVLGAESARSIDVGGSA